MQWLEIGYLNDIPVLGSRVVKTPNGNIAVFRTSDNNVFALLDRCPHKNGQLSQGMVYGEIVVCPLHSWRIDLSTGQAIEPDVGKTPTFATRIEADGRLFLQYGESDKGCCGGCNCSK